MARRLQQPQTPLSNTHSRSIYDASARQQTPASDVPTGACNFINLNIAGNVRCGCQRYFDKSVTLSGRYKDGAEAEVSYWCMCEHHACYHEVVAPRSEVEQPAAPLSIMPSREISMMSIHGDTDLPDTATAGPPSTVGRSQRSFRHMNQTSIADNGRITLPVAQPLPQVPRATSRSTQRHESLHVPELPDIPSQCFLPSNVSSGNTPVASRNASFNQDTAANARAHNHLSSIHDWIPDPIQPYAFPESVTDCASLMSRHFDNDIPQTNFSVPQPQPVASQPIEQAPPTRTASRQSSRITRSQTSQLRNTTLVIRPSGSQDGHPNKMELDSPSATSVDLRSILPHIPEIREHYASKPSLKDKLREHEDRLEHLENQTHSVVCASERDANCECDCDLIASRIDRHDTRVGKIERALSARKFRGFAQLEDGEHSFVSEATTDISTGHQEMYNRVDSRLGDIENRMSRLDGHGSFIGPSAANAWAFEVVFLPFGAELAKVWSSGEPFGSQMSRRSMSRRESDRDLVGLSQFVLNTEASASKFFTNAPRENSWEHALEEAYDKSGILSARACNVDSLPDQRLRSRGLVRTIEVKGPDAQHAQFAIFEAFGDLLQTMAGGPPDMPKLSNKVPKKLRRYREALNSSWIPLRKLHRESKLQFLQTSEMMTSTSWNTSFLAEVAMNQAGKRRLFITGRESYIQHENNLLSGSGWTWETIRQLQPFDPDASQVEEYELRHAHTPSRQQQMVLSEPCWEHDEKLDGARQPQLPDLTISATHQSTTTVQQSHLKFPLSVQDSFSASFHSVEHDDDGSSSIANSSSSIASSPAPSEHSLRYSNSPVPMQRKISDSISPLTSRNAFENINISTHRRPSRSHSRSTSQTPGPNVNETPFGLEMARKRINPYSSIFEDVATRRSYPLSSSPAKATTSSNYLNIKRQRTRSPSRPRDTHMRDLARWSVGRSSPSPFIYEDRSRSNTRETTAGPANLQHQNGGRHEGEGEKKRGLTPFAYATPFSNAPIQHVQMGNSVKVKRERSWGSAASGGLRGVEAWNDGDEGEGEEEEGDGYESDFFQPRQVGTPGGVWGGAGVTDNEDTMRQGDVKPRARARARVSSSSFGAEAHALSDEEEDGDEGEISDAPSEYPSTQANLSAKDKGKGVTKAPLADSTEKFVDVNASGTFEIHED